MTNTDSTNCVDRIPDVAFVRQELARNMRDRELLTKLLKLAERKVALARSRTSDSDGVRLTP
jgi:hypothetical protein